MDPLQILLETASRRLGAAQAQLLMVALRRFIGDARARSWTAWLGRRGFWADMAIQAIASLRPGHLLAGRHALPAGITAAQVDELWEEFVEGVHRGIAALPAGAGAPVAPLGAAPPVPPVAHDWTEELGVFIHELPRILGGWLAGVWPWLACTVITGCLIVLTFAMKSERQIGGLLGWLPANVRADASPWLHIAKLITATGAVGILGGAFRAILTAPAHRFAHAGRLANAVLLALVVVPMAILALVGALDVLILSARINQGALPIVLWLIQKADRYALLLVVPAIAILMSLTGIILAIDSVADKVGGRLAKLLGFGDNVNFPLEKVASGIRGFGLSMLAGGSIYHLASTRWPAPQQVLDFLLYGIGLVVLSSIILTWAGFQSSTKVKRVVAVGFILVITTTTLWVWYNARHAGVVEGAVNTTVQTAHVHRAWFETQWAALVNDLAYDVRLAHLKWGILRGIGRLVLAAPFAIICGLVADGFLGMKGIKRIVGVPFGLVMLVGFGIGLAHVGAVVYGWFAAL